MKKIITISVLFFLLSIYNILIAQNIEGVWDITEAQTLGGDTYSGTVDIQKETDAYNIHWNTNAGEYNGVGIKVQNVLYVGWGNEAFGIVVYKIKDKKLDGVWTTYGGGMGQEVVIDIDEESLEGTYEIKGKNPGGDTRYDGELTILKTGDTYQLEWTTGEVTYFGIGLRNEDILAVGWGMGESFGYIEYTFDKDSATGRWTIPGFDFCSFENLER